MKNLDKINLDLYRKVFEWRDVVFGNAAKFFIRCGITANFVSFFRLFLCLPLFFIVGEFPLLAIAILLINFILDGLDGVMARVAKTDSKKGRALDVGIDNFYIIPLILGLIWTNQVNTFWASSYITIVLVDYFVNYIKFGIEIGNFPFSFSKFFFYFAVLVYGLSMIALYDYLLVFWSVFLLIIVVYNIVSLYGNRRR